MVLVGTLTLIFPLRVMITYKNIWLKTCFIFMKYVLGLRYQMIGKENLPDGPYMIACKHQSALETFILPYEFEHLLIILKKELVNVPVIGWYFRKYRMIAVNRSNPKQALRQIVEGAKKTDLSKSPLLIFPEGTRTEPGVPSKYQIGIAVLYESLQVPVVPVAVNTGVFWPRKGLRRHPGLATLQFLPPIQPGLSKSEFMAKLENDIENASMKLYKDVTC